MGRIGHENVRTALIYQHGTSEAGKAIADALNNKIEAERDGGPTGVLVPAA
ncbi:hypothetical protein [Actinomadura formosensis]|uniref:hypothetical protein n=1 Tax=Actinomadura formosensis TaxID=60706 RepID=UPI000AD07DAB|nr:hypothetical protein [Actinomadura formosensis]